MPNQELRDYELRENVAYEVRVRTGPINGAFPYLIPFHSSMKPKDPLRRILEARGLETATQLSEEGLDGQHLRVTLVIKVEREESE